MTAFQVAIIDRAFSGAYSIHVIFSLESQRTGYIQRESFILNSNHL